MTDLPLDGSINIPAGVVSPGTPADSPAFDAHSGGWYRWVSTVDHKVLGVMYMTMSLIFFLIGGLEATAMRIQLSVPRNAWLSPNVYDALFTLHGVTMIFLVIVPVQLGMAVYIVPLQIGARDMAMPRLNALSFWCTALGGVLLYLSVAVGHPPEAGWFAYAPLSLPPYSFYQGMDYWALSLLLIGIGTVTTATNMALTIFTLRAPGLTIRRLPLFSWMMLVDSFLIIFAMPIINAALVMVLADRLLGTHFFNPLYEGSAVVYQHLFWSFGHPEVYIMIIPAWGMIWEVIPVFSRKPIFGYTFVAMSTVAIALLSFGVWVHHMFTMGLPMVEYYVFSAASMLIAVPTGVKIFAWIGTMIGGSLRFTTSMMFAIAFLIQFTLGGLVRRDVFSGAGRLAIAIIVLSRGAPALRSIRRRGVRDLQRVLLLVPQDQRTVAVRTHRQMAFLADGDRLQRHLHGAARPRFSRNAAAHLYLPRLAWLADSESHFLHRRDGAGILHARVPVESNLEHQAREERRQ